MSHSPGTSLEAVTIGRYLAASLADLGVTHVFALPGDSIIPLLVEFLAEKRIEMVWCTNELNTGYACDGYARRMGFGACIATYGVGALSIANAIAGCCSERVPCLVICGTYDQHKLDSGRLFHHCVEPAEFGTQRDVFSRFTCAQATLRHPEHDGPQAPSTIHRLLHTALARQKPAFLEISPQMATTKMLTTTAAAAAAGAAAGPAAPPAATAAASAKTSQFAASINSNNAAAAAALSPTRLSRPLGPLGAPQPSQQLQQQQQQDSGSSTLSGQHPTANDKTRRRSSSRTTTMASSNITQGSGSFSHAPSSPSSHGCQPPCCFVDGYDSLYESQQGAKMAAAVSGAVHVVDRAISAWRAARAAASASAVHHRQQKQPSEPHHPGAQGLLLSSAPPAVVVLVGRSLRHLPGVSQAVRKLLNAIEYRAAAGVAASFAEPPATAAAASSSSAPAGTEHAAAAERVCHLAAAPRRPPADAAASRSLEHVALAEEGAAEAAEASAAHAAVVAVQPNAKGLYPESDPRYRGIFWGSLGSPAAAAAVSSARLILCIGTVWTNLTTAGFRLEPPASRVLCVAASSVTLPYGAAAAAAGDYLTAATAVSDSSSCVRRLGGSDYMVCGGNGSGARATTPSDNNESGAEPDTVTLDLPDDCEAPVGFLLELAAALKQHRRRKGADGDDLITGRREPADESGAAPRPGGSAAAATTGTAAAAAAAQLLAVPPPPLRPRDVLAFDNASSGVVTAEPMPAEFDNDYSSELLLETAAAEAANTTAVSSSITGPSAAGDRLLNADLLFETVQRVLLNPEVQKQQQQRGIFGSSSSGRGDDVARINQQQTTSAAATADDDATSYTVLCDASGAALFSGRALQLRLPDGGAFEAQLTYGSLGWSTGAVLGQSLAASVLKKQQQQTAATRNNNSSSSSSGAIVGAPPSGSTAAPLAAEDSRSFTAVSGGITAGPGGQALLHQPEAAHTVPPPAAAAATAAVTCVAPHTSACTSWCNHSRVLAFIGDGGFRMGCQEVSTMLTHGASPIILLLNNSVYGIEEVIHTGPFNQLSPWDYVKLVESLAAGPAAAAAAAPPEHQRQPQLRHQAQLSIDSGGNKAATDEAAPPKVAAASPAAFNASSDHAVAVDTPAIGSGSRSSSSSDKLFAVRVETVGQLERALAAARGPQHADSLCFIEVVLPATDEDARLAEFGRLLAGV